MTRASVFTRYKLLSSDTWPTYRGSAVEGCKVILEKTGFFDDVEFGKTKLFIKTPKTVFTLEEKRSKIIPTIVCFLQQVSNASVEQPPPPHSLIIRHRAVVKVLRYSYSTGGAA